MIAVGRALLQDDDWTQKIKQDSHDELDDWASVPLAMIY
jgi:2,4-dienoyl-CoA reductase-like NADH-dependent reductase (Old Yellow Enzyme family)